MAESSTTVKWYHTITITTKEPCDKFVFRIGIHQFVFRIGIHQQGKFPPRLVHHEFNYNIISISKYSEANKESIVQSLLEKRKRILTSRVAEKGN